MQILKEPKLITEKEDVHLIETFLISTKPNEANWTASKHDNIQDWVGRDFVIIPEKIFDLNQKQPGHVSGGTFEEQMAEIKRHSHGKITKVKGPYSYDDGTDDQYWNAIVRLNDSLSASTLVDNGSKTWTKFAVSPSIWRDEGTPDNVTKYRPMGLFLVIKGAYGDKAVIEKMCEGSELKCGTALSAAIFNLNHDTNDEHLGEILSSYIKLDDVNKHTMSQVEQLKPKEVTELPNPIIKEDVKQATTKPIEPKQEIKVEQPKGVTISNEEFEAYKKEREEHKQLVLENKTNKLNELFSVVEDAETKSKLVSKYIDKDVNLIVQYHKDVFPHVEKYVKGKDVPVEDNKDKSKSASVLKEEPKIETDQSESASVVPNKVNEVLIFSKMFAGEVL